MDGEPTAAQIRGLSDAQLLSIFKISVESTDKIEKQANENIIITQQNKKLEIEKARLEAEKQKLEAEKAQLEVENGNLKDELKKKQPPISESKDDPEIENLRTAKQQAEARAIQAEADKQQAEARAIQAEARAIQAEARAIQAEADKQQAEARANQAEANNQNQWQIPLASGLAGFALGGFLGYNLKPKKKKHRDMPDNNYELI